MIIAKDVSKTYGQGANAVLALDRVTVGFDTGAFAAIMGPSGSGKSTLMHCLAGLDTVTSGSILVGDTQISGLSDRQLTPVPPGSRRLRLPVIQPAARAHRGAEHPAAA